MQRSFSKLWPWFFLTAAFESLAAAVALSQVPSESGLSLARLGLFGALAFFFAASLYGGWLARRKPSAFERFSLSPVFPALLVLILGLSLFFLRYLDPKWLPVYHRLAPLLWYLFALGIQALVFFALLRRGFHPRALAPRRLVYLAALLPFGALTLVFFFVALSRVGIEPDEGYWGEPGAAIQGWQFALSLLAGAALFILLGGGGELRPKIVHLFWPLAIYLTAVALWLSVPLEVLRNSFYAPITPPLNIPLPYSDAGYYDYLAQSLLIGGDYLGGVPPRPLYVTFLAALHFFFGQNYSAIIAAQTCVLALFPLALYFLGKRLHSPAAGLTAALFAVFRELVSLWISSDIRSANSKIFTTDFPTAMALAFLSLVFLWWLERRDFKSTWLAGGCFGLALLFRTQSLLVLPVVFILAWFAYRRNFKQWTLAAAVFALPMILTVLPWLIHNYGVLGKFAFDDPGQMATLYSQYGLTGHNDLSLFDPQRDSLPRKMISFTLANPAYVARFMTSHFLNTEIGGLLTLPLIKPFNGLFAPVNLYWATWTQNLEWYNSLLLLFYLAVIALGLAAAWRRARWAGLIPLAVNFGYALSNAVARFSSWRYNLPVDWVAYFYFALGAMEIFAALSLLFGTRVEKLFPADSSDAAQKLSLQEFHPRLLLPALAFALIGASPWLAKGLVPLRYTASPAALSARFVSAGYNADEIAAFLSQPASLILEGRALYPRMFRRDEGIRSAHPWAAYQIRGYPRMTFLIINAQRYDAIFPTKQIFTLPQGADVTALACRMDDHIQIRVLLFDGESRQSAPLGDPCPLSDD